MPEGEWEVVAEVAGDLSAEILRGLLEAQGIQVWLSQEGAGKAYGLNISTLGNVQILVPAGNVEQAGKVLEAYYKGQYENETLVGADEPVEPPEDDLE